MSTDERRQNVLVTGGAGFIGSHLCARLVAMGHRVVAVDDLSRGRASNLEGTLDDPRFELVCIDMRQREAMGAILSRCSVGTIIHLAANSDIRSSTSDPRPDLERTLETTLAALELAVAGGVPELVFASSSAVFGPLPAGSAIEEFHGPCAPISFYGAAKLAGEGFVSAYAHQHGLKAWVARFPNIVGGRATHGILFDLLAKLEQRPGFLEVLGDGTQCKPYLLVDDLLDALLFAWRELPGPHELFHVPARGSTSVARIAELLVQAHTPGTEIRFSGGSAGWRGDVPHYAYGPGRLAELGWAPRWSSDQAIAEAIRRLLLELRP